MTAIPAPDGSATSDREPGSWFRANPLETFMLAVGLVLMTFAMLYALL